ncbi:MAG: hypothetical protein FWD87_01380 [Spirochaetaceae bacterium]|nr:hypothetical protein [Spirochaetaceae bacterium]
MDFTLGNLITIAIVITILMIYRRLDINNRSLERMKKYFNKIKEELDSIVEEKAMGLKDLSIELEVHEKTVKEVYNRIDQSANDLAFREQELVAIHKKIDSYDAVLKELSDMTSRVDENLKKLHEESIFVDDVSKKIKEASSSMDKLENRIPQIIDEFTKKNEESAELLKIGIFNEIEVKSNTIKEQLEENRSEVQNFSEYLVKLEERRDTLGEQAIKDIAQELEEMSEQFSAKLYKTEEGFEKVLLDIAQKGATLSEDVFKTVRKDIEEKASEITSDVDDNLKTFETRVKNQYEKLSAEMKKVEGDIEDKTSEITNDVDGNLKILEERVSEQFEKLSAEIKTFEKNIEDKYVNTQQNSMQYYENVFADIKEFEKTLNGESGKIEVMKKEIDAVSVDFEKRLEAYKGFVEGLEKRKNLEAANFSKKLDADVNSFEQIFLAKIEKIEEKYNQRFAKANEENNQHQDVLFNELRKQITKNAEFVKKELLEQIETVDSNVVASLSRAEENIKEYEETINYKVEGIIGVEKDISEMEKNLKNMMNKVGEKIKDDFRSFEVFIDTEKSAQKVKLDNDFKEIREVLETLENRIGELKKKSYENVTEKLQIFEDEFFKDLKVRNDAVNNKLELWQKEVAEKIDKATLETLGTREEIETKCIETMKDRLNEIQVKANAQFQKYENNVNIFRDGIDEKLILIEKSVKEFEASLKTETEDAKISSHNHFNKEFTEYQSGIDERLRQYEKDIVKNIDALTTEYSKEKDTLVHESSETREIFNRLLKEIAINITKLNDDLKEKSEAAIEKQKTDAEFFMNDFTKKNRDFIFEIDTKIKEFKIAVQDVKNKIENTEKKIMIKISENMKALNTTLNEIDKKQKSFVNQTKIFDRADTLRNALDEKIEELKRDIIKVDTQSKDIKVAEKKFDSIRKLEEEVSTKLNRLLSEKRKIDEIEGDFKKLLNISQAVDTKLEHVTTVYDGFQEIDVKLRGLDDLFKEVDEKSQRLEKKEGILEATIDAVDKNFQTLQKLEKGFAELSEIADMFPVRLNEVEARFKKISMEKSEADKVIGKLESLSKIMGDIEERIDKVQNSREWLARTETRLNESVKKAEDSVTLLGSLMEKDSKVSKKTQKGGAPSLDKREMVVKLAHQGWTSDNIAQATGLSRGEVELILEIMPKK